MVRLNSRSTPLSKYLFPTIWFGFLAFFAVMAPFSTDETFKRIIFMVAPFPMAAFGYFLMKKMIFSLVDEIYRQGDTFVCINTGVFDRKKIKVTFSLNDIQSAQYYTHSQPSKCVIRLRHETALGRDIEFIPKIGGRLLSYNKDVEQLIDDLDKRDQQRG